MLVTNDDTLIRVTTVPDVTDNLQVSIKSTGSTAIVTGTTDCHQTQATGITRESQHLEQLLGHMCGQLQYFVSARVKTIGLYPCI